MSFADGRIADHAKGLSFADIGGLWGTTKEKISVALDAGVSSATMIDITSPGHELWHKFDARMGALGHRGNYKSVIANLDDPALKDRLGTFDFIHSAGIIYHAPNPVMTMMRYRDLTGRYLVLGSMVVPDTIETKSGKLDLTDNATYFVPGLSGRKRRIFSEYFDSVGIAIPNINGRDYPFMVSQGAPHYGPWWWLWTIDTLAAMCEVVGFRVLDKELTWGGRSAHLFLEAVPVPR